MAFRSRSLIADHARPHLPKIPQDSAESLCLPEARVGTRSRREPAEPPPDVPHAISVGRQRDHPSCERWRGHPGSPPIASPLHRNPEVMLQAPPARCQNCARSGNWMWASRSATTSGGTPTCCPACPQQAAPSIGRSGVWLSAFDATASAQKQAEGYCC